MVTAVASLSTEVFRKIPDKDQVLSPSYSFRLIVEVIFHIFVLMGAFFFYFFIRIFL